MIEQALNPASLQDLKAHLHRELICLDNRGVMQGFDQNEAIEGNSIYLARQAKGREVGPGDRNVSEP